MYFSLFSVIMILIVGAIVYANVARGVKYGFARSSLRLAILVISAVAALLLTALITSFVADIVSSWAIDFLTDSVQGLQEYRDALPELDYILTALIDMLLGPLVFLPIFCITRFFVRILVSIFSHRYKKRLPTDPRLPEKYRSIGAISSPDYDGENSSWFRRNDRVLGGVVGAVSGFLVTICMMSPLVGTANLTATVYDGLNRMGVNWEAIMIDSEALDNTFSPFAKDVVLKGIGAVGGQTIYDATASAPLHDETVVLQDETERVMLLISDVTHVAGLLNTNESTDDEQLESLKTLGKHMNESAIARLMAVDFVKGAAGNWLEYEPYLTVERPVCGAFVDPLMDQIFYFLYLNVSTDYVGEDLDTMLGIYSIALHNRLFESHDTETLMTILDEGGVLDDIYMELERNPRMSGLVDYLTNETMNIVAQAIMSAGLTDRDFGELMDDLAEAVTLVNGMNNTEFAEQVNTMSDYAIHYADQYGITLPAGVAQMAVTSLMSQFSDQKQVSGNEMQAYINSFLKDTNGES